MAIDGKELLDYACTKFQNEAFDEALEAFILAYSKGYEQEWILETIYSCYMSGNEEEFRNAYERQTEGVGTAYEDCILDFIPCRDGEYYIYDKEKGVFCGLFSVHELQETTPDSSLQNIEFSAAVLEMKWNWKEEAVILSEALRRKVYLVSHDVKRCVSFCKIPELAEYAKNIKIFADHQELQDYFHQNTSVYLPKIICGKEEDKQALIKIMNEEHEYRLTPEGRNTENILLTIGIPTHDRGNLLLERIKNLCKMTYDTEVEFAISKNGTHYYQEEYRQIKEMTDARINYVGYDCELTMSKNWQNVIKIAHGRFVMLVSDEDDVIGEALEHYLKLLSSHENLAFVRSRTSKQYSNILSKSQYLKKGKEAFFEGFLKQNYLSGAIYNRSVYLGADIDRWNKGYEFNSFYRLYPHVWWQAVLAFEGDYAEDAVYLVQEGDCVLFEEIAKYRSDGVEDKELVDDGMDEETSLAYVSTYAGRIEQFEGAVLLIRDFERLDEELKAEALIQLIHKTLYLMDMVRIDYHYKTNEYLSWVEKLAEKVVWAVDELLLGSKFKRDILTQMLNILKTVYEETGSE